MALMRPSATAFFVLILLATSGSCARWAGNCRRRRLQAPPPELPGGAFGPIV